MTESTEQVRAATILLAQFPQSIRDSVIDDKRLANLAKVTLGTRMSLGPSGPAFNQRLLLQACRIALAEYARGSTVTDDEGVVWELSRKKGEDGGLVLSSGGHSFAVADFWMFSGVQDERMRAFRAAADRYCFGHLEIVRLSAMVMKGPLTDDEYEEYLDVVSASPASHFEAVYNAIGGGEISIGDLVPSTLSYYERLVGRCGDSESLEEFVRRGAKEHCDQLMVGSSTDRLKYVCLLSGHASLLAKFDFSQCETQEVVELYSWARSSGDLYTKLALIEIGVRLLGAYPELYGYIAELTDDLIKVPGSSAGSQLDTFCALFSATYGEVARLGIFGRKPPFWKRLATIAHVCLLQRAIIKSGALSNTLDEWFSNQRAGECLFALLCDLRREPRWLPEFAQPSQMKAEFAGRLIHLGAKVDAVSQPTLSKCFFGEAPGTVAGIVKTPESYFAGPLEGGVALETSIPNEYLEPLRRETEQGTVDVKSFTLLVNLSFAYNVGVEHASLASRALSEAKFQLSKSVSDDDAFALRLGLAAIAAMARSEELAKQVRILSGVVRRSATGKLMVVDEIRIALVAAAAYSEIEAWASFLGDWLSGVSMEVDAGQSDGLLRMIRMLCIQEPALIRGCAKAIGTLRLATG